MRLLKESVMNIGFGFRTYYEEKETNKVRNNNGSVVPRDAVMFNEKNERCS